LKLQKLQPFDRVLTALDSELSGINHHLGCSLLGQIKSEPVLEKYNASTAFSAALINANVLGKVVNNDGFWHALSDVLVNDDADDEAEEDGGHDGESAVQIMMVFSGRAIW